MRFHPVLAAASFFALVAAAPSGALPAGDFCDRNPFSPLCSDDLVIDPIDPCDSHPELCEPPDPCIAHPELCEPPDPCEVDPASCEPVDPCVTDPASCEAEPEPDPVTEVWALTGSGRVKGHGFKAAVELELHLAVQGTSFSLIGGCKFYQGQLAPSGKKGEKFQLFLDDVSSAAYGQFVSERASAARGVSMGAPIGESTRMILKRRDDGTASLNIKSEQLLEGGGVVFKARLKGAPVEQLAVSERCVPQ